jgi:hypothetical protein
MASTTLFWVIERQHSDETWHAVASKSYCRQISIRNPGKFSDPDDPLARDPVRTINAAHYRVFDALSGHQFKSDDVVSQLAMAGLPNDVSQHSRIELGPEEDIHSPGWILLYDMEDFCLHRTDDIFLSNVGDRSPQRIRHQINIRRLAIFDILKDPDLSGKILVGPSWDDQVNEFPQMAGESNHQKFHRKALYDALLPISGNTVRFIIGYDN